MQQGVKWYLGCFGDIKRDVREKCAMGAVVRLVLTSAREIAAPRKLSCERDSQMPPAMIPALNAD